MSERDQKSEGCRTEEVILLCCAMFGMEVTVRLLGYAQALRENCRAQRAVTTSRRPC